MWAGITAAVVLSRCRANLRPGEFKRGVGFRRASGRAGRAGPAVSLFPPESLGDGLEVVRVGSYQELQVIQMLDHGFDLFDRVLAAFRTALGRSFAFV